MGFGKHVAKRRSEWAGQYERGPKQQDPGHLRVKGRRKNDTQNAGDQKPTSEKSQSGIIRQKIAKRCAQGIGKEDGYPIKYLRFARSDIVDRDISNEVPPEREKT